ncbi:MAG: hypothetical protein IPM64_17960 [Phycisphaerales bacterium]|nr:hypothetical protein [Phycisphaerales bacterium]
MAVIESYYTYRHNTVRVCTAPTPGAGSTHWTERPYLRCDGLTLVAAPDIDQCVLSYVTGRFIAREADEFGNAPLLTPTWFDALELNRQYVKVEVLDNNAVDPATGEQAVLQTWYGLIEADERSEAQQADEATHRTGRQTLTAFGLLRLLERQLIRSSVVKGTTLDTRTIGRGLPFNFESRGAFSRRGNRTRLKIDGVYVFNFLPERDDDHDTEDNFWTGSDAVQYLLKHHAPVDAGESPLCDWVAEPLTGGALPIDFLDITVETDRRSVKEVLDQLIDRRRMVGYWVYGREVGAAGSERFEAVLKVFTFTDSAVPLDSGEIPANQDLQNLIAGASTLVGQVQVRQLATSRFDEIVAEGAYITSTLTLRVGANAADVTELVNGWTASQEQAYLDGAGGDDATANTLARARDELRDVFARFLADNDWPQTVAVDNDPDPVEEFFVAIYPSQIPQPVQDADVHDLFLKSGEAEEDAAIQSPLAFHTHRFLDLTPLKDAQTNEYRRPFAFFGEGAAGSPSGLWSLAEHVSAAHADRRFNCSLRLLQDRLGFHCEVNQPGGQHLIAASHYSGANATPDELQPATQGGLEYENLRITGTLEWDDKVRVRKILGTPTGEKRVLVLAVPDARLDFVLPGTVTDISESGGLVESTGAVLDDDRLRLAAIVEAAAIWYGTTRQAITLTFRELRPTLAIGTLLQRLWGVSDDPINTPVTGIRLDFRSGTTSLETSYAELDFAAVVEARP